MSAGIDGDTMSVGTGLARAGPRAVIGLNRGNSFEDAALLNGYCTDLPAAEIRNQQRMRARIYGQVRRSAASGSNLAECLQLAVGCVDGETINVAFRATVVAGFSDRINDRRVGAGDEPRGPLDRGGLT
jgi:hypothetical protein